MDRYITCPPYLVGRSCEVCDHEIEDCDAVAVDFDGEPLPDGGYRDYSRVRHWWCHRDVELAGIAALQWAMRNVGDIGNRLQTEIWRRHKELAQEPKVA